LEWLTRPLVENRLVVFIESMVAILLLWSILANVFGLSETVSSPSLVAASLVELYETGLWWEHLSATLPRVMYGFALTLVVGTVVGVATGMNRFWEKALQDYVTVGLALPSLFVVIFAAMWFGVSDLTPTVAAAAISFPYLAQEVYEGVKNIDNDLLQMASSFEVSRQRSIRRIIVQSVLPQWFGGARYSFSLTWKITTLAELVAAESGIGFMIGFAMDRLSLTDVFAWTIMFTILMLILEYGVLRQIERRVFEWRQDATLGWE
jgi:ABC-type nitrate/sulfonate/bicarbonate transport system permease component